MKKEAPNAAFLRELLQIRIFIYLQIYASLAATQTKTSFRKNNTVFEKCVQPPSYSDDLDSVQQLSE